VADLKEITRQSDQRPEDADLLERLARARLASGDVAGAELAATRAVALDPMRAEARFIVGLSLSKAGNLPGARAALRKALQANPLHAGSLLVLGALEAKDAAYPEAERLLKEAIRAAPDFVSPPPGFENPYRILARVFKEQKKGADAQAVLADWAARDPEAVEPRRLLAQIAISRKDADAALRALDEAILLAPFDPEIRRLRAEALEGKGRKEEAGVERGILDELLKKAGKAP
jgi:tetratricopeptide (TPR) repeat protein